MAATTAIFASDATHAHRSQTMNKTAFKLKTLTAMIGLGLFASTAFAVDSFDPATNLLSLDAVTMNGTVYSNVAVTVNSYSLLGVGSGTPADNFDPASNILVLGAVAFQGAVYNNVSVKINSYTLPTPTPAPAPTPPTTTAPTTANNYYVATTGSDSNSGTQSAPFRTIKKAASMVKPDTTVHVAPGTYAETINSTVSGTASGRIRYVSDTKWGAKIVPASTAESMWKVDGGYTDIDGFQLDGTGSTTNRIGIELTGGNSAVMNNWVHHVAQNSGCDSGGGSALSAHQWRGPTFNNYDFTGNLVHDIGGSCEFIQGIYHASSGTIKNNIVYAANYGIHLYHDDHDIDVVNNTVFGNRIFGIVFGGCQEAYSSGCPTNGINIHNNIVYDNYGGIAGPIAAEDGNNTLRNNLVYGNSTNFSLSSNSVSNTSGAISADPQFVNYIRAGGGDYHLKSTSPAIGNGLSTKAPSTDMNGTARPGGAGIDIGALENY